MDALQELEAQRDALLAEMKSIRSMKRGTINEQYLGVRHVALRQPVRRGPYFVLSRYDASRKKTISRRLTTPEELDQTRSDVAAYKRYVALCDDFERVTERLGEVQHASAAVAAEKKRRRLRLKKNGR